MPQIANILSEKYYNQFSNGTDFGSNLTDLTANLTGSVGEKIKAIIRLSLQWYSNSDSFNTWLVEANQITRFSGSFRDDGFAVGHVFNYISGWSTDRTAPIEFNGTVTAISADGLTIAFTVNSGVVPTGTQDDAGIRATAGASANYLTALFWRFGLIANDASFSNQSNVSGNNACFFASAVGVDSGSGRSTAPVSMTAQGTYRDWLSGQATAAYISSTTYEQVFEVAHEFVITPFYLEGQLSNLQETVVPDYLQGENTLKYAYQAEFRLVLSNPNTAIVATFDQNLGSVGWFGENFNGLDSAKYEVVAVTYEDTATSEAVTALQNSRKTTATITISKIAGALSAGQRAALILFYLAPQNEYQNTTTDIEQNFMLDAAYFNEGTAPVSVGNISAASSAIDSGDLVITAEIELSALDSIRATGGSYFLGVQIADSALSASLSDRVILLADVNGFKSVSEVDSFISFEAPKFYYHDFAYPSDTPVLDFVAWNEDGFLAEWDFALDLSKDTFINSLTFILAAFNTADSSYFELDRYRFETASAIIAGGVQQIEIEQSRGYFLASNDQFNFAKIQTGELSGTMQGYKLLIGQKTSWQDWIFNASADTVFFDSTKPNNNLNFKSSNYSGLENYQIRVLAVANVSGTDSIGNAISGDATGISTNIAVFDYNKDGNSPALWTGVIRTFDPNTDADLGGRILSDRDTLFEIEWEYQEPVFSSAVIFCIHRIEITNDAGSTIQELSNIIAPPSNSILKPLQGETLLKVTSSGGKIYSRCLIDYTKLTASSYNLSGRLQR